MAEPKTKPTKDSVAAFIAAIEDETRRKDSKTLDRMFRDITGEKPVVWGPSIIGYGSYEGPTGTWMCAAFSPRKANLVLYMLQNNAGSAALMKKLGKHKAGKGCVYINKLADIDQAVLAQLISASWAEMNKKYG